MASTSSLDTMYLDNLDEYINDENKVVTYRWLSITLQVHVNLAKQMLFNFVKQQRSEKDSDCLHVTYFVAGITDKRKDGTKVVFCSVVPEEKLETVKSSLQQLHSCHIYSVQKSKLKDSSVLYITDYQEMKENEIESSRYSAVKYDAAQKIERKVKTEDAQPNSPLKTSNETSIKTNRDNNNNNNNNNNSSTNNSKNSVTKSVIAGMFAQCNKNNISKQASTDQSSNNSEPKKEQAAKKVSKKPTGVLSFFSSAGKSESIEIKSENTEPSRNTSNNKQNEVKKSLQESDSEDDMFQEKKRRRIVRNISSDEEMESEEPLPSPPSPEMMPTDADIKDDTMEGSSAAVENGCEQNTEETAVRETESRVVVNKDGKRRKRIKRQKNKTFIDDEGFMVTKKVMVSDSTDVSDEETEKNSKPPTTAAPVVLSAAQLKKPASKTSVPDKGQKKQSSLMSFFNKK
ncbi:DNA polymerase delta subunit 3 isoform X2 [Octopus bimaculoides]|uniref:DNA polymerase delta subunit 3 isoform X2 n=1 Tax=Octopus bimaculoides TaxID=37653 RepID=UPI00071C7AD1|nr:DNA polymerase delta subunit 3 isoform X2 [Octopus bimaculoides]|eukprot:XP_014777504.1 PREDICTED: DNA polymerase delta subunit 3-like isoform X2 [Octopus bimaculoides]